MSASKKIFLISSIALVVLLLFWGIYNLSFKKPAPKTTANNTSNASSASPAQNQSQIIAISDEAVLAPTLSTDSSAIKYYSKTTGQVYQIDLDGANKTVISNTKLVGLVNIFWSPDKTKVLAQFLNNNQLSFSFYDYAVRKGSALNKNIDAASWNNLSNKIFLKYLVANDKTGTLEVADPDGSNWNKITDLNIKDLVISSIPKTGLISFWNAPDAFTETSLQSVPIIGGDKKSLFTGKFGVDYLWSPDGSNVLVSHTDGKGGSKIQLALVNNNGGEYKNLDIPTFISKCAWSKNNKFIYYALPGSIPDGTVLPNDYNSNKFSTADTFWKVNITTGEKTRLVDLNKINDKYDAANLFLNSDESVLFFTNKIDGKLYRINL